MVSFHPCTCLTCRAKFQSPRRYASYCSNACRQKAYRDGTYTPHPAPVQDGRNHRRIAKSTKPPRKKRGHARPAAPRKTTKRPPGRTRNAKSTSRKARR